MANFLHSCTLSESPSVPPVEFSDPSLGSICSTTLAVEDVAAATAAAAAAASLLSRPPAADLAAEYASTPAVRGRGGSRSTAFRRGELS